MAAERDPNIYELGLDERSIPGYASTRNRVGAPAGSQRLGTSSWNLPPGQSMCRFHFHLVEEEQLIVIEGRPLLRGPDGWRRLERGAVVAFLPGSEGVHQVHNDTDEPVLVLAISTNGQADVLTYPDAGEVAVFDPSPTGGFAIYPLDAEVAFEAGKVPPPTPPTDIP